MPPRRRFALHSAAIVLLLLAAGVPGRAASPDRWVTFRRDYRRSGRTSVVGPQTLDRYRWRTAVAANSEQNGAIRSSPSIGLSGDVYITAVRIDDSFGHVHLARIAPDGRRLWLRDLGRSQTDSSPSLASDDTIYIGAGNTDGKRQGTVLSLLPNNDFRWISNEVTHVVLASPALSPDQQTVYAGTRDGLFYALNAVTSLGSPRWVAPGLAGAVDSSPAVGKDGTVYFGSQGDGGRLNAVSPEDGEAKWTFFADGPVEAAPALSDDDGTVYFGSLFGIMYAVDTRTGLEKWANTDAKGGYFSSAAIGANGTVVVGNDDGSLYAFDAETGRTLWTFPTGAGGVPPGAIHSSPAIGGDGTIYFGCDNGLIFAVGPDGVLKSYYRVRYDVETGLGDPFVASSPAIAPNGTLYIGADDGYLYAFNDRTESIPGDINQDGRVNIGDALLALRHVVGSVQLTTEQVRIGDIFPKREDGSFGNGVIDIADVVKILRFSVGLDSSLP